MFEKSDKKLSYSKFLLASIPGILLLATLSIILILVIDKTHPSDHKNFWTINMIIMLLILSSFSLLFVIIFAAKTVQKRVNSETNEEDIYEQTVGTYGYRYDDWTVLDAEQLNSYGFTVVVDKPPSYESAIKWETDFRYQELPPSYENYLQYDQQLCQCCAHVGDEYGNPDQEVDEQCPQDCDCHRTEAKNIFIIS